MALCWLDCHYAEYLEISTSGTTFKQADLGTLGYTRRFSAQFGNGSLTSFTVAHGLGVHPAHVSIWKIGTPRQLEFAQVTADATNVYIAGFLTAPTTNSYMLEVVG